ncbi:MAG: magnesium chelatase ATPase subunit I [Firmicutes bacterium]|nr:magnesium chelatase ATPase subunit I [Bacillota bacterium]
MAVRTGTGAQPVYPFTAIVGQDELRLALILTAIDPLIGGVLALGDRGTAKSTAVRALAQLLPPLEAVDGCPFRCDPGRPDEWCSLCRERDASGERLAAVEVPVPVVDLPLGASEDRVVGSLDIEAALVRGEKVFEPGLLARANRGFLYIDEVNLLEDHLVDLLLDVAASGVNVVEREGISLHHPARFVLIGSGNPEEGDLRPQLLDRFGLFVPVKTIADVDLRVEIVRRRDEFERDPRLFAARFAAEEMAFRERIARAQERLASVDVPESVLQAAAALSVELGLDGHRGELSLVRAARALAAWEGRSEATRHDVAALAPAALAHRLRRDPLDELDSGERVRQAMARVMPETPPGCIRM